MAECDTSCKTSCKSNQKSRIREILLVWLIVGFPALFAGIWGIILLVAVYRYPNTELSLPTSTQVSGQALLPALFEHAQTLNWEENNWMDLVWMRFHMGATKMWSPLLEGDNSGAPFWYIWVSMFNGWFTFLFAFAYGLGWLGKLCSSYSQVGLNIALAVFIPSTILFSAYWGMTSFQCRNICAGNEDNPDLYTDAYYVDCDDTAANPWYICPVVDLSPENPSQYQELLLGAADLAPFWMVQFIAAWWAYWVLQYYDPCVKSVKTLAMEPCPKQAAACEPCDSPCGQKEAPAPATDDCGSCAQGQQMDSCGMDSPCGKV